MTAELFGGTDLSGMLRKPFELQAHVIAAGTKMLDETLRPRSNPWASARFSNFARRATYSSIAQLFRRKPHSVHAGPELIGLEVMLQEDPDEDGRARAVVCAELPEVSPDDQVQAFMRRYHERLITELPLSYCPLFALVTAQIVTGAWTHLQSIGWLGRLP